ncbi:MAG: S-methyl-5-thioribose-1-phosphate isomerase [candidate division WOR-3 bacterium]
MRALFFKCQQLVILDQTKLPNKIVYRKLRNYEAIISAIKHLQIRGAPLIGIAGAYSLVLAAIKNCNRRYLTKVAEQIRSARPTAVNLSWAINRMLAVINNCQIATKDLVKSLISEAKAIEREEESNTFKIGEIGANLIKDNMTVMTICNTGWLATVGIGTALGVIYTAVKQGKRVKVYVLETRPLLQGARLTAFELSKAKIPYTLITDNMMATVMPNVDIVLVGADRIAQNGDVANKIGTLTLAITAHYFKVPFYVVAPTSSLDLNLNNGKEIVIEKRDKNEVIYVGKKLIAPKSADVFNPAFDITPASLISGIVTEKKIFYPPFKLNN